MMNDDARRKSPKRAASARVGRTKSRRKRRQRRKLQRKKQRKHTRNWSRTLRRQILAPYKLPLGTVHANICISNVDLTLLGYQRCQQQNSPSEWKEAVHGYLASSSTYLITIMANMFWTAAPKIFLWPLLRSPKIRNAIEAEINSLSAVLVKHRTDLQQALDDGVEDFVVFQGPIRDYPGIYIRIKK